MAVIIASTLLSVSFLIWILYALFTVFYRKGTVMSAPEGRFWPKVSILKPLKNTDDQLEQNLESFFRLDYPDYEIIFGVDSEVDPSLEMIESLKIRFPLIHTTVVTSGHTFLENPKIHKLIQMEDHGSGVLYWVTDSNVRVNPSTLKSLVQAYLTQDAKIVFSPIRGTGSRSIGSIMENAGLNLFSSGNIILAWKVFKQQIIVGKSILLEKKSLEKFGGFAYFRNHLAEDFILGETYAKSRIPISTNFTWITNINQTTSIRCFFQRMSRWAKLRFHLNRTLYFGEVLLNPIVLAALFLPSLKSAGWYLLAAVIILKICIEYLNFFLVNTVDRKKLRIVLIFPVCIILKDLILFLVYLSPFMSSKVTWRGGEIGIGKHTLIGAGQDLPLYDGV